MLRYAADWLETIEDFRMEPAEVIEAGGETFVVRLTGTARGSAPRVSQQLPVVWTFRDDKLVYGREYSTRDEALRAAGLSDPRDNGPRPLVAGRAVPDPGSAQQRQ
jgi:ketosteroid isomerase-like protein